MKACPTYTATIYCGLKEGYDGPRHALWEALDLAQAYVDEVGLCVTVTETAFVYKDGCEHGVAIGLISYPRFPSRPGEIAAHAIRLAWRLKRAFQQNRVSVVFPEDTYMLEGGEVLLLFTGGKGWLLLNRNDIIDRRDGFGWETVPAHTLKAGKLVTRDGISVLEVEQVWREEE